MQLHSIHFTGRRDAPHSKPRSPWKRGRTAVLRAAVKLASHRSTLFGLSLTLLATACAESAATTKPPVTAAELGEPDNEIDPKIIGAAVRGNTREFQLCYASARERNPSLAGQVDIRFVVHPDGSVGPSAVAESSLPKDVSECIARTFLRLTLPQQERAVVAQYPMFLDPN